MEFHKCKMETKFLAAILVQFEESGATLQQLQFLEKMIPQAERSAYP